MTNAENIKKSTLAQTIAALDSMIVCAREQQIALARLLAEELGAKEEIILEAIRLTSLELLKSNGLEY